MASIDEIRSKFYDNGRAPPTAPAGPSRTKSSTRTRKDTNREIETRQDPEDGDAPMNVDVDISHLIFGGDPNESDVQLLIRLWQNERSAPEILHSQDGLLGRVLDHIRRQTNDVEALRRDVSLTEEDHYMTTLVQTEVERVKFIVRSYVRTRLFKIERYAAYITTNSDVQARLSQAELQHAQRYATLIASQFGTAVLNHLPESQQDLDDDIPIMPKMISEPSKERPVFIRARQDCDPIELPDGTPFTIEKDSIHLMRYRTVEQLLARGEVDLV